MTFYKKSVGRPTEDEQAMISSIERTIAEKGIPLNEIPECQSLEDLIEVKILLESYQRPSAVGQDYGEPKFSEEGTGGEFEDFQETEEIGETPFQGQEETPHGIAEEEIPDVDENAFVADNYDPFAEPIIERSYNKGQQFVSSDDPEDDGIVLEDSKGSPLSDLPPVTKRRAAEQTADALLKQYAWLAPQPFKWLAKINESKVEKMAFNGELDLSIQVSEGVTFDDYMKQTNQQIDEIFAVEQDTLDEIREPLIEVLMEQELELTPTQRLAMAIISHLSQMFTVALKLRNQNNRILSYQKHLTQVMQQGSKVAA